MTTEAFDWTNDDDAAAAIVTQFTVTLAELCRTANQADIVGGFLSGRYAFHLDKTGLRLLKATLDPLADREN